MLNIPLHSVDAVARDVLAIGTDYTPGTLLPTHSHRRAQFLYGMSGLMEVETDDGAWTIPPYSGVWIPASKPHSVRMQGVSTRSLYIEPAAAPPGCALRGPGRHPAAAPVAAVLRRPAGAVRRSGPRRRPGHAGAARAGLGPQPAAVRAHSRDEKLAALCKQFLAQPSIRATPQDWAQALNKSLRTFSRFSSSTQAWPLAPGASRPACWQRCRGCLRAHRSPRWRWSWDMTAPARFPPCSARHWGGCLRSW